MAYNLCRRYTLLNTLLNKHKVVYIIFICTISFGCRNKYKTISSREFNKVYLLGSFENNIHTKKVRIVIFHNYQCAFCKKLHANILSFEKLPISKKASFSYIQRPFTTYSVAFEASVAAECAKKQEEFIPVNNLLYKESKNLPNVNWAVFAQKANLKQPRKFISCIQGMKTMDTVKKHMAIADSLNINGTPQIIIDGKLLNFLPSVQDLKNIVKNEYDGM